MASELTPLVVGTPPRTRAFFALHKRNTKRPMDGCIRYICHRVRKRIETSFRRMPDFFAKRIYAITTRGIELKAFLAVLAFSIDCLTLIA